MSHKDNPTVPKYILEITKTSLDFLEDFADSLPLSGKGPISAVKRVITLVEVGMLTLPPEFCLTKVFILGSQDQP